MSLYSRWEPNCQSSLTSPKSKKLIPKKSNNMKRFVLPLGKNTSQLNGNKHVKIPRKGLRNGFLPPKVEARAYGWKEQQVDGRTLLTGYGKLKPTLISDPLQQSGKSGVFCEPPASSSRQRAAVQSISKLPDESQHTYFLRSYTENVIFP